MKISFIAGEVAPYATSGGLGDVMSALPTCLAENCENQVEVIAPLYGGIKPEYRARLKHLVDYSFKLSWRDTGASAYYLEEAGVRYIFIENHYYFDRPAFYGAHDDAERFAFFSKAALELYIARGEAPDILHANDWQAAMAIVYLKTIYSECSLLSGIKTVYTIHNIEHQGKFDPYILGDVYGLGEEYLGLMTFGNSINLMKAAIETCDYLTTVSETYAHELEYDYYAFGLDNVIKSARSKMTGIINGIDYTYFSPAKDKEIVKAYSARMVKSGKEKNKIAICERLGLDTDPSIPLLVMITRLATQKGIDLFLRVSEEILNNKVQVIILGTGEEKYEKSLKAIEANHSNMRALIEFDRKLSKQLYASADLFLMPSKFEPCGLSQMIACSYGALPIVRLVGGLKDTIIPHPVDGSNGFGFDNYNAHEMLSTIEYALSVYQNEKEWKAIRSRALSSNFSWSNSAAKYLYIYNSILN